MNIDSHYELKHPEITDQLVLELVKNLDGKEFKLSEKKEDWEFYMLDKISHGENFYRLVWCMQDTSLFIGVINCFRR